MFLETCAEIVPHQCLHVSIPKEAILRTLEKVGGSGYDVLISDQVRLALDVTKRKSGVASTASVPSSTPKER